MSFKASARHYNRFIIEAEIRVPWNSAVKNNSVVEGDIGAQNSIADKEKQENSQLSTRGREYQFKKMDDFCFNERHRSVFCKSKNKNLTGLGEVDDILIIQIIV